MTRRGTRRAGPATAAQRFVPGRVPEEGAIVADDMTEDEAAAQARIEILRRTWGIIEGLGLRPAETFYAILRRDHPSTGVMFPPDMKLQREKLFTAIGAVIANLDQLAEVVPVLQMLGRDHRRFGITKVAYGWVGDALLEAIGERLPAEDRADPDVINAWTWAYGTVAQVMIDAAAEQAAAGISPWVELRVVSKRRVNRTTVQLMCDDLDQTTGLSVEGYVADDGEHYIRPAGRPGLWALTITDWALAPTGHVGSSGEVRPSVPMFTYQLPAGASTFEHAEFMALAHMKEGEKVRVGPPPYAPMPTAEQEDAADVDA